MKIEDHRCQVGTSEFEKIEKVMGLLADSAERRYRMSRSLELRVDRKPDGSLVTDLDSEVETDWRKLIHENFPGHSIVGEEFGTKFTDDNYCWYLDPVDGTDDLARGIPLWGFILALRYRGLPIAAAIGHPPLGVRITSILDRGIVINGAELKELPGHVSKSPVIALPALEDFLRERDQSSLFLELARHFPNHRIYRNLFAHTAVLIGALDAAVEINVAEWDVAATQLLIEEAGGRFVEFQQRHHGGQDRRVSVVFGKSEIVADLLDLIRIHGETGIS